MLLLSLLFTYWQAKCKCRAAVVRFAAAEVAAAPFAPAISQNVSVIDGLHDDSAVVSACKELLKGRHASCSCRSDSSQATYGPSCKQQAGGGGRNKPLWGVCVLRGLQRLCSGALHTPDDQLYAFRHRARTLLAAEKALLKQQVQLQQKGTEGGGAASVASTVCSTAATVASETPNEENEDTRSQSDDHSDNKDDAAEAESCSINLVRIWVMQKYTTCQRVRWL